ncbi:MAG TPA: pyruvate dehydrogenase (acetyl-transferring) E1 component subunit alpha, partial [Verrucomicrobiales bacterium]|nr:pyruvate dehydrogenase (acetyl-transferring) E1 component subunit alpha [Verrucomicrobiales bacterium]
FAEESPPPTIEDITNDVYWETDNNTEASQIGRHFFND